MDSKKILFILIGVAVLSIGSATLFYNWMVDTGTFDNYQLATTENDTQKETSTEDKELPDFTVYDREGNAVKLSDFAGQPIVLNFWASWCTPCKSEMPIFDDAYHNYGDKVAFLMVNMTDGSQETMESALEYLDESVYRFPVYFDTDMDAAATYGITSLPTTFFIDAEGNPQAYAKTTLDKDTLKKGIGMILP